MSIALIPPDSHSNSCLINQVICDTFYTPWRAEIRELLTIHGVLSCPGVLGRRGEEMTEQRRERKKRGGEKKKATLEREMS